MKPQPKILVVEDEAAIAELIAVNLRHNGFQVQVASDGAQAQQAIDAQWPDLVLLDWMLPTESGLLLVQRWRTQAEGKTLPVIMLTARGAENDRVAGLDAGADDYITKPFSTKELLARVRAVLRRHESEADEPILQLGPLSLDAGTHRVHFAGQPLKLGPTEFKLLQYLLSRPERVHSRSHLLDRIWGDQVDIEERTVDVHVKRLREALGDAAHMVETVRGVGYRMTAHAYTSTAQG